MSLRNSSILLRDLRDLSSVTRVLASQDLSRIIVGKVLLPPGWNRSDTRMLVEIPEDYPFSPPGVGSSHIYLETGLRFKGRIPTDYHEGYRIDGKGWAWLCYQSIDWQSQRDNLISLLERVRADLSKPSL